MFWRVPDRHSCERIFGRFYRTEIAVNTAIKGSGLGLAIARRMIEAQGGALSVTSAVGVGSTFTMTLPVAARSTSSRDASNNSLVLISDLGVQVVQ